MGNDPANPGTDGGITINTGRVCLADLGRLPDSKEWGSYFGGYLYRGSLAILFGGEK